MADIRIKLLNVRLGFADTLFNPRAFEEGKPLKYGVDAILTPGFSVVRKVGEGPTATWVPAKISQIMLESANEAFKGKGQAFIDSLESSKKLLRGPGRLSAQGEPYADYEGLHYVASKDSKRPMLYDADKSPLVEADGKPYSGCYANVVVDVYTMTDPKKKGVFAKLRSVQFDHDGDAFSGSKPADDSDFDKVTTGAGADPMDDDIPF